MVVIVKLSEQDLKDIIRYWLNNDHQYPQVLTDEDFEMRFVPVRTENMSVELLFKEPNPFVQGPYR